MAARLFPPDFVKSEQKMFGQFRGMGAKDCKQVLKKFWLMLCSCAWLIFSLLGIVFHDQLNKLRAKNATIIVMKAIQVEFQTLILSSSWHQNVPTELETIFIFHLARPFLGIFSEKHNISRQLLDILVIVQPTSTHTKVGWTAA